MRFQGHPWPAPPHCFCGATAKMKHQGESIYVQSLQLQALCGKLSICIWYVTRGEQLLSTVAVNVALKTSLHCTNHLHCVYTLYCFSVSDTSPRLNSLLRDTMCWTPCVRYTNAEDSLRTHFPVPRRFIGNIVYRPEQTTWKCLWMQRKKKKMFRCQQPCREHKQCVCMNEDKYKLHLKSQHPQTKITCHGIFLSNLWQAVV